MRTLASRLACLIIITAYHALAPFTAHAALPTTYQEPPFLQAAVAAAQLPPIAARLPATPRLMDASMHNHRPGRYGGQMRMLMGKDKDIRRMTVFGYARLVGYNHNLQLVADLVESFTVNEGREFIFHLRRGHRWSDGAPFTSADFRYYWEEVANNKTLSPFGPPQSLRVADALPTVEFPDRYTIIYRWASPNPYFLPELAGPRPLFIYQPAHYLQQFHANFAPDDAARAALDQQAQAVGSRNWAGRYFNHARQYKLTNPALPSLQPWVNTTAPPSQLYTFQRNPFFHRVDANGLQMPYIDEVLIEIVSASLIPAKAGAGETDLQGHYLRLDNYTFLKAGEARNDYRVLLWNTLLGAHKALYPNLNSNDAVWRELVREVRFRRALSLGIDRHEINQVIYFGLATSSSNTVLPACPLHTDAHQRWARHDLAEANALLDELGLVRNAQGVRLRADGQPLEIIIHTAGESTEETDILELIQDSWQKLGLQLFTRPSQRQVFRDRIFSGEAMMSIWSGLENAMPTADMSPHELAPSNQNQYQWPKWGQHYETGGAKGEPPQLAAAQRLLALNTAWRTATSPAVRAEIWADMLATHSDEVYTIGIVNSVPQPIIVHRALQNIPEQGFYAWSPTAYFGIYHPDIFWFDRAP